MPQPNRSPHADHVGRARRGDSRSGRSRFRSVAPTSLGDLVSAAIAGEPTRRFSILDMMSIATVLATGVVNTHRRVDDPRTERLIEVAARGDFGVFNADPRS
jgi:hypothetical protein